METKLFDQCPNCGCSIRVYESAANQMILEGKEPADYRYVMQQFQSVIASPKHLESAPIGSKLPAITTQLDICQDCGTVYAISVEWEEVEKRQAPIRPIVPNAPLRLPPRLHRN